MNKHRLDLIFICLFLHLSLNANICTFSTPIYTEPINRLVKARNDAYAAYSACKNMGIDCAVVYLKELNNVYDKIDPKDGVIGDYFKLVISNDLLMLQNAIGIGEKPKRKVKEAWNLILTARKSLRKTVDPSGKFKIDLSQKHERELTILGLTANLVAVYVDSLNKAVESQILPIEFEIYQAVAPHKTLLEIEDYLTSSAEYKEVEKESSQAYNAMLDYYKLYTLDGNYKTYEKFLAIKYGSAEIRAKLRDDLKNNKVVSRDMELAKVGEDLLLQARNNTPEYYAKLDGFIKDSAPKTLALKALQRSVAKELDEKQYKKALEKFNSYQEYFCDSSKIYQEACKNYLATQKSLEDLVSKGSKTRNLLRGDINEIGSNTKMNYIFSDALNYMALIPTISDQPIQRFKKNDPEGTSWLKFDDTIIKFNPLDAYWFIQKPLGVNPEHQIIPSQEEKMLTGIEGFTNCDFFIYTPKAEPENKILFFSSSTNKDRMEKNESTNEYISPWLMPDGVSLQEYDRSEKHNGKKNGNTNTDLYVSFHNAANNSWYPPRSLGSIVNTRHAERSPFYDGSRLYFASEGHGGLGDFDIFSVPFSYSQNRTFIIEGSVVNEFAVNTSMDDFSYVKNDLGEFISSNHGNSNGEFKIYKLGDVESAGFNIRLDREIISEADETPARITVTFSRPLLNDVELPISLIEVGNLGAINGVDYKVQGLSNNKLLIKKGQNSADFSIIPLNDRNIEGRETIVFQVDNQEMLEIKIKDFVQDNNGGEKPPSIPPVFSDKPEINVKIECDTFLTNPGVANKYISRIRVIATDLATNEPLNLAELSGTYRQLTGKEKSIDAGIFTDEDGELTFDVPSGLKLNLALTKKVNGETTHFKVFKGKACEVKETIHGPGIYSGQTIDVDVPPVYKEKYFDTPLFFEYNQSSISTEINNLEKVRSDFNFFIDAAKGMNNLSFIVIAFADTTGSEDYNCDLASMRAKRVTDRIVEWGLPKSKVSSLGFGETFFFDKFFKLLANEQFGDSFPMPVSEPTKITNADDRIRLQLNRRAHVLYCPDGFVHSCIKSIFPLSDNKSNCVD